MKKLLAIVVLFAAAAAAQSHHFERKRTESGGYAICAHCGAPENAPSVVTIAPESEPGERIVISGTVFRADGKTPAKDIMLLLYHTDVTGYYNKDDDAFQPRLYAYLKTDANGHYEFRTIKPGRYPNRTTPAHIHISYFGPGVPESYLPEYWFEGDSYLKPEDIAAHKNDGDFSPIVRLSRGTNGVLHGVRNLRLPE